MKKDTLVKALAIIVIPGGIPVYIGYKTYQFGKWIYKKRGEDNERNKRKNRDEHKSRSEKLS